PRGGTGSRPLRHAVHGKSRLRPRRGGVAAEDVRAPERGPEERLVERSVCKPPAVAGAGRGKYRDPGVPSFRWRNGNRALPGGARTNRGGVAGVRGIR